MAFPELLEISEKEAMVAVELGLEDFFNGVREMKCEFSLPQKKRVFKD